MDVPTEGHYGASQFFDGMDVLAIHEISQAPQHESIDFVKAQLARTQQGASCSTAPTSCSATLVGGQIVLKNGP